MRIKKATISNAKLLFEWANEIAFRINAINSNPILWEIHIQWLQNKLENNKSLLLIGEIDEAPIGQIRFDHESSYYFIDYSIAKTERGKGYGFLIVKEGISAVMKQQNKSTNFIAWVKPENGLSKRVLKNWDSH